MTSPSNTSLLYYIVVSISRRKKSKFQVGNGALIFFNQCCLPEVNDHCPSSSKNS